MKKLIAIIIAALLAVAAVTAETTVEETPAEAIPETYVLEGSVVETGEEGILVNSPEMGDVMVLVHEETLFEGETDIKAGDYIFVDYNGMMTRSLPPQINAMVIRNYQLSGTVAEMIDEENALLLTTETHGDVYVRLPEAGELPAEQAEAEEGSSEDTGAAETTEETDVESFEPIDPIGSDNAEMTILPLEIKAGDAITVYYNGVMTMSLPGQINAALVIVGSGDVSAEG